MQGSFKTRSSLLEISTHNGLEIVLKSLPRCYSEARGAISISLLASAASSLASNEIESSRTKIPPCINDIYIENIFIRQIVMIKYLSRATFISAWLLLPASIAQAQTANVNSTVGNNSTGNNVIQTSPQTTQQVTFPNIPLSPVIQNPINTENDFGLNLGGAVNTLDGRNMTLYLGITYQPGRTDDHNVRMAKLKSETQLLESQKQTTQAQLQLLRQQVAEQEIRLRRIQSGEQVVPK